MFSREEVTWNLRDRHFLAALQLVEAHLGRLKRSAAAAEQAAAEEAEKAGAGAEVAGEVAAGGASQELQQPKMVSE